MKPWITTALAWTLACAGAWAQDKKSDAPERKPGAQQQRMKECNAQASDKDMKGEARKKFMSACLKAEVQAPPQRATPQQKMASCSKEAGAKNLKGDERKAFMSECLKG